VRTCEGVCGGVVGRVPLGVVLGGAGFGGRWCTGGSGVWSVFVGGAFDGRK